jgi:prevent-host-death family protein
MREEKQDEQFVTTSDLQSSISEVIRRSEGGERFVVMRYSKPLCVLIGFDEYKHLRKLAKFARGGACRVCNL